MKTLFLVLGSTSFGLLVYSIGIWYGQPFLSRQFILKRLNRPRFMTELITKLPCDRRSITKQSAKLNELVELSELLDTTARNLRLGQSLASALQIAIETSCATNKIICELVAITARGMAFADANKQLLADDISSDLAFALRTLELAATGGVGGVLALERSAIVLRERSTNIYDRDTQAAQAMLSTKVLSWAPVVVAGWLLLTSTAVRNFLLLSVAGWLCILLGVSFNYAGRKWMQTIVFPTAQ